MAVATTTAIVGGIEAGSELFGSLSGLFGGGTDCDPSAVIGDPRVVQLAEALKADPTAVERLKGAIQSIYGSHDCQSSIQASGPEQLAVWAIYIGTGFTDRNADAKDSRVLDLAMQEIEQYQATLGTSFWGGNGSSSPSSSTSGSFSMATGLGPGVATGAIILGVLVLLALVWALARG